LKACFVGEMAAFGRDLCATGANNGVPPPRPDDAEAEAGRDERDGLLDLGLGLIGCVAPTAASADSDDVMKKAGAYSTYVEMMEWRYKTTSPSQRQ
jgi:hypothetical protein